MKIKQQIAIQALLYGVDSIQIEKTMLDVFNEGNQPQEEWTEEQLAEQMMAKKMLDNVGSTNPILGHGLYGAYPYMAPISDSTAAKIAAIHAENDLTINWELQNAIYEQAEPSVDQALWTLGNATDIRGMSKQNA